MRTMPSFNSARTVKPMEALIERDPLGFEPTVGLCLVRMKPDEATTKSGIILTETHVPSHNKCREGWLVKMNRKDLPEDLDTIQLGSKVLVDGSSRPIDEYRFRCGEDIFEILYSEDIVMEIPEDVGVG